MLFIKLYLMVCNRLVQNRCHQHFASTAEYVYQTFAGSRRTNEGFAGAFYSKVQTAAPCDCHIAVDFQYIILQIDFNEFFSGAGTFQGYNAAAAQTKVE